jgi:serine/threonine protein kinase
MRKDSKGLADGGEEKKKRKKKKKKGKFPFSTAKRFTTTSQGLAVLVVPFVPFSSFSRKRIFFPFLSSLCRFAGLFCGGSTIVDPAPSDTPPKMTTLLRYVLSRSPRQEKRCSRPLARSAPQKASSLEDFAVVEEVGRGSFGSAYSAHNILTNKLVCIKVTKPNETEVEALKLVSDHPNIVTFVSSFLVDESTNVIEMELVRGVDLFEFLDSRSSCLPSEDDTKMIARQICSAVAHCHSVGVAHRDLKPENFHVDEDREAGTIKLTLLDFNLSIVDHQTLCTDAVGTVDFAAPETLREQRIPYDASLADAWSVGVVLYQVRIWRYPFIREHRIQAARKNLPQAKISFHKAPTASTEYKDLVQRLTMEDPSKRVSVQDALSHPWFEV